MEKMCEDTTEEMAARERWSLSILSVRKEAKLSAREVEFEFSKV